MSSPLPAVGSVSKRLAQNLNDLLICAQACLLGLMFSLLFLHESTLVSYVCIAGGLAVVSGVALVRNASGRYLFVHGIILFLAVRLVYFFSTNFKSIPFGDSYWDLAVLKTFLLDNDVSIVQQPLYPPRLMTWYSSWPLLYGLEVSFVQMTGVAVETFHMLLAIFISSLTFVFGFLLIREISKILNLQSRYIYLAVAFFAISPEAIFWGLSPTRQEMGMLLLTMSFYLLLKTIKERRRTFVAITLLCLVALTLSHHFTSAIGIGALAGLAILVPPRQLRWTYATLGAVLGISVVLWWGGYAKIIFESPAVSSFSTDFLSFNLGNFRPTVYPDQLAPNWALLLLRARDIILYGTPIVGGLFMIRKAENPQVRFMLLLAAAGGLMLLVNLSIGALEPTRVLMLFMPFFVILSAFAYFEISRRAKLSRRQIGTLLAGSVSFVVVASFVGLWGHDFAPLHLFDNSINSVSIGENGPSNTEVKPFLVNNVDYSHIDKVLSEFHTSLALDLPESQYGKIRTMVDNVPLKDGRTMVVSTDDLYVYKYYAGFFAGVDPHNREALRQQLSDRLSSFDLTYSDGSNRVWK